MNSYVIIRGGVFIWGVKFFQTLERIGGGGEGLKFIWP